MFLQFQKNLGEKILLKGGAATQFYNPVNIQRTSIDIDMVCYASKKEVHQMLDKIENELNGEDDYCKFRRFTPANPKVGLDVLETYFETVPSICSEQDLYATAGDRK